MVVDSARELTDSSLSQEDEAIIGEIILSHKGLKGYHHYALENLVLIDF